MELVVRTPDAVSAARRTSDTRAPRYIKTKHDPVIADLLKRVARLEKKVTS